MFTIVCRTIAFFVVYGGKRLDEYLINFMVTDNMKTIVVDVDEANRIGYIRSLEADQEGFVYM
ncbi:MAG: hypothetical protein EOM28_06770 [Clostridia bacterium]|nr:hypothetical protein [Clostridia bacterium]